MAGMIDRAILRSLPRRVGRRVMQAQIEGTRMLPRDVFNRPVCQQVGEITRPLDRREVFPQICTAARGNAGRIGEPCVK